jgi:hypothetical protein
LRTSLLDLRCIARYGRVDQERRRSVWISSMV